ATLPQALFLLPALRSAVCGLGAMDAEALALTSRPFSGYNATVLLEWIERFLHNTSPWRVRAATWFWEKAAPSDQEQRVNRLTKRGVEFMVEAGVLWLVFGVLDGYR